MDMDSDSGNEWPNPERLKTLASNVGYAEGNNLLHQFVLGNSPPYQSRSESYLNAHLLTIARTSLDANAHNKEGYTPLHLAVLKNNSLMVKKLLSCLVNIDVNTRCHDDENTALHLAANLGHLDIVEALLDKEASIDVANTCGDTALCLAAQSGHLGAMKLLVRKGANVNLMGSHTFPLHCAAGSCNFESVIFLVSNGADLSSRDIYSSKTVLHYAAESGDLAITEFLVSNGADVDAETENGQTPLCYAARSGHLSTLKFLLDRGANLNIKSKSKSGRELFLCAIKSVLCCAIRSKSCELYKLFSESASKLKTFDWNAGKTALHYAVSGGHLESAALLIDKGADVNAKDECGLTPLQTAVRLESSIEVTKMLIDKGADVNAKDEWGLTVLHLAVIRESSVEVTKMLIDKGADVNAKDESKETPLHTAVTNKSSIEVTKMLIERGANVNAKDECGCTPLHTAVVKISSIEVTKMLIDKGADVNAKDEGGQTPLHKAIMSSLEVTKLLIERGADVNATDNGGRAPLHHLLYNYEYHMKKHHICKDEIRQDLTKIKLLLEGIANVNIKDIWGRTLLGYAKHLKSSELIELFSESATKPKSIKD